MIEYILINVSETNWTRGLLKCYCKAEMYGEYISKDTLLVLVTIFFATIKLTQASRFVHFVSVSYMEATISQTTDTHKFTLMPSQDRHFDCVLF